MRTGRCARAGTAAAALLIAALVPAGCAPRAPAPDPAAPDSAAARAELLRVIERHHRTFESVNLDGWAQTLAPDAVMIAADPLEYLVGRDTILRALKADFESAIDQGLALHIRSEDLRTGVAPEHGAAWLVDALEYTIDIGGEHNTLPLRFAAFATPRDTSWEFAVVHYSRPVAPSVVDTLIPIGTEEPNDPGSNVARGADPLVKLLDHALAAPGQWEAVISNRPDVLAIGPSPKEVAQGPADAAQRLEDLALTGSPTRSVRAGLAPGGRAGWITAVVEPRAGGVGRRLWHRISLGLLKERAGWRIVLAAVSIGVKDPEEEPAPTQR